MGDIVIKVLIDDVYDEIAQRSSIATETDPAYANKSTEKRQLSQMHGESDRITGNFVKEAANKVKQAFINRQGNVEGLAFEYDRVISAGESAVKQKETITMTGTEGSAYITEISSVTKKITFVDDLTTTNEYFVRDYADYYDNLGIVLTSVASALIFEAKVAGVPFTAPVVDNKDGDLAGTTEHTTANVTSGQTTTGCIIYRVAENSKPLKDDITTAIVGELTENTKYAIIYYALLSLHRTDANWDKKNEYEALAKSLIDSLTSGLYRLHD